MIVTYFCSRALELASSSARTGPDKEVDCLKFLLKAHFTLIKSSRQRALPKIGTCESSRSTCGRENSFFVSTGRRLGPWDHVFLLLKKLIRLRTAHQEKASKANLRAGPSHGLCELSESRERQNRFSIYTKQLLIWNGLPKQANLTSPPQIQARPSVVQGRWHLRPS